MNVPHCWDWAVLCISSLVIIVAGAKDKDKPIIPEKCSTARNKCMVRIGCGMALHNYYLNCDHLIRGNTRNCTPECKKALASLMTTEEKEGESFMTCDCENNRFCLEQKRRMEVCANDVLVAMKSIYDDSTDISCSLAHLICSADTSCYTALGFYQRHCSKLWRGEKCTPRCNNSIAILYRQTKARKLRTCRCEGTEHFACQRIQENTESLCFGPHRHRHHHNHTRTHLKGERSKHDKSDPYDKQNSHETKQLERVADWSPQLQPSWLLLLLAVLVIRTLMVTKH